MTQNWVCLWVGVEPKDTRQPKNRKREGFTGSKYRTPGKFPKAVLDQFSAKDVCMLVKGLGQWGRGHGIGVKGLLRSSGSSWSGFSIQGGLDPRTITQWASGQSSVLNHRWEFYSS